MYVWVLDKTEELLALLLLLLLLLRVVFTRYETPRCILICLGGVFFQLDLVVSFRLYVCIYIYSLSNQTNQKKSQIRVCVQFFVCILFVCFSVYSLDSSRTIERVTKFSNRLFCIFGVLWLL